MNIIKKKINKFKYNENIALNYFKQKRLDKLFNKNYENVYPPNLKDLYFIYKTIIQFKRINILEFGCGFSSLIIRKALSENKKRFNKINFEKLGLNRTFEHIAIDDQQKYIQITKKRNKEYILDKSVKQKFVFSQCKMTSFKGQICSEYEKLANIVPDFIYLDGPNLNEIKNHKNNINLSKNTNFTPMSCDILKIENLLLPGTIIMIDGRGLNSSFLKNNLKRNWIYYYNNFSDQHFFYLEEVSVGKKNSKLLTFYNS